MKNALVTVAVGHSSLWEFTHPLMQRYADKTGSDFIKITGEHENTFQSRLQKFAIYDLFEKYDRIIYMDGDIAINPECPDLFELVPYNKIGAVCERPPYAQSRGGVLKEACEYYGVEYPFTNGHECIWFNTGLMVLSRCHKDLFVRPEQVKVFGEGWVDMPLMNSLAIKNGYKIHDLGIRYNYMGSIVSHKLRPFEPIDSYIFHATGFLRHYRLEYLKLVVSFWTDESRSALSKRRAYQMNTVVLSYRLYESARKKAAKLRRLLKLGPNVERNLLST